MANEIMEKVIILDNLQRIFLENYSNLSNNYERSIENLGFKEEQLAGWLLGKDFPSDQELKDLCDKFSCTDDEVHRDRGFIEREILLED
ncbi:MAG TPA: hypothetical protein PKA19_06240 [Bacillota bacterium]|nr:hypothetical protein [Bacillota bacterium]